MEPFKKLLCLPFGNVRQKFGLLFLTSGHTVSPSLARQKKLRNCFFEILFLHSDLDQQ